MLKAKTFFKWVLLPFALFARDVPEISSWTEPTVRDFEILQEHLQEQAERDHARFSGTVHHKRLKRVNDFSLLVDGRIPEKQLEIFNTDEDDRSCLIVTYASYNEKFIEFVERQKRGLEYVKYKGHFLYWIGGWPFIKGGGLEVFDTPYAFKICALLEARAMGYEKVIWLDSRICPLRNLKPVFCFLDKMPIVMRTSMNQKLENFAHPWVLEAFDTSAEELKNCVHYATGVLGVNLRDKRVNEILDKYFELAKNREGFMNRFPCQVPWSLLLKRSSLEIKLLKPLVSFSGQSNGRAYFKCDYHDRFDYPNSYKK
ncbi:MAG: hypothetical protein SNF33_04925 [Candidatus Algichlamydia australiensis]|nr:hypothetical protein [Chlamydiales bacterium]